MELSPFEQAKIKLERSQTEGLLLINALQLENTQLRETVRVLQQELNQSKESTKSTEQLTQKRPKLMKAVSTPLFPTKVAQRLQHQDDTSHKEIEKAGFRLFAHLGDDVEELSPKEITIPVLVKSFVEMEFLDPPKLVFVTTRPNDPESIGALKEICSRLLEKEVGVILQEGTLPLASTTLLPSSCLIVPRENIHLHPIDFIVTLGGDGTFIYAADCFKAACPPILAFHFGSLGFLTPFPALTLHQSLDYVMTEKFGLRLRARLEVELHLKGQETQFFQVLNECVLDRGASNSLVRLDLFSSAEGAEPVTTVLGDGLIIASPTGSTAYSLSAGGTMVHPSVPAILVTPICPSSLSFRPIIVPDSATLRVKVCLTARHPAFLSLDGKPSIEMKQGDELFVRFSRFPVPAIMTKTPDGWLSSLRMALNWNHTTSQKPL